MPLECPSLHPNRPFSPQRSTARSARHCLSRVGDSFPCRHLDAALNSKHILEVS